MKKLSFLKALFSPFVPFTIKMYYGPISIGVPYFLPRRWRNFTEEEAKEAAEKAVNDPQLIKRTYNEWLNTYRKYQKSECKKFGIDLIGLGWKIKWTDKDYRFEWAPMLSIVGFKRQLCFFVVAPEPSQYWESWLYYERNTDKTKSVRERVKQLREEFPQTWKLKTDKGETIIDYYFLILKEKYII